METTTLDCGHGNDWGDFAMCRDSEGRTTCRACAHASELETLRSADRAFLYLKGTSVTDWGGLVCGTVVGLVRRSRVLGHRLETFRVRDVNGATWAARHWPDSGDYVRLRKLQVRSAD